MNPQTFLSKAELLQQYLERHKRIGAVSWEQYEANELIRLSIERTMQVIVDCAMDLNAELFYRARKPAIDSYYDAFIRLSDIRFVKVAEAKQLATLAGFRNRLVHEYDDIDDTIVYGNIARMVAAFAPYMSALRTVLAEMAEETAEEES